MTYEPFPRSVEDNQNDLHAWIGADGDRDDAAVALSVHHQMRHMTRTMRTAILAGFPEPVEPELVPSKDFNPPETFRRIDVDADETTGPLRPGKPYRESSVEDWPPVVHEDQASTADVERILERLRAL
jgi:hypothetical protein